MSQWQKQLSYFYFSVKLIILAERPRPPEAQITCVHYH